jgi:nitrogen fixation/metabolism regulation signal transduction histidine kinase
MPRALRYGLLIALALGGVLLYLLAAASGNTQAFARNYPLLLAVNGVIAALLFLLVITLITRVVRRIRARRFGARLMARFAVAFALMGVVPGALIYLVSVQFLSKSIESWFDVRVDRALESGLTLGRAALEAQLSDLTTKARAMAPELADVPESAQLATLDRVRERAGVHEAVLVSAGGQLLSASGVPSGELVPALPQPSALRQARIQRVFAVIEGDETSTDPRTGLRTRVIVPVPAAAPVSAPDAVTPQSPRSPIVVPERESPNARAGGAMLRAPAEARFLQLTQRAPPSVLANAAALLGGYREYQDLSLSRSGLRKIYTVTLTLTLLLAVFAAIASGVLLASSMTAPLLQVAAGTRAVAEGDFRPVREFAGNDELNLLTQSFNAMTRQLTDARDAVEARSRELENARAFLERVLTSMSAGVLVLDSKFRLVSANHGASRILGTALAGRLGEKLAAVVPSFAERIEGGFADQALAATPKDSWQRQIEVMRVGAPAGADPLALLVRGSRLPLDDGPGFVVVFDDITQIISAQRALAWGEVARRLAHEIKNPLTPIQLAAERLHMKLADKLPPEAAAVLTRGASTIVNQVTAMKRMVDDFRDYARLPAAKLAALDLNALVTDVAALYGAAEAAPDEAGRESGKSAAPIAPIVLQLEPGLPPILGDAAQLRQVIHNLIGNAQEAMAQPQESARARRIAIRTEHATLAEAGVAAADVPHAGAHAVRLSVDDEGPGFPANILRRAFEPYVTTKPSGTGLGLAMVKKIIDEHDARIELVNRAPHGTTVGASVTILFRQLAAASARAGRQDRLQAA